jgi:hypothetical protein
MCPTDLKVRLELREDEARALHAGLREALAADLLNRDHEWAARDVLARLAKKVPSWLDVAPVRGEAGYVLAAAAVLRVLVDAEDRGRSTLTEPEVTHGLGNAKPAGVSIADVLGRMRRERLLRTVAVRDGEAPGWSAAPAGRRFPAGREGTAASSEWRVTDAEALAELIFREHRPYREAFRPAVQAIGQLADPEFEVLADELRVAGLLGPEADDPNWLTLTDRGSDFAEKRVRATLPRFRLLYELPPPPIPYVHGLPLRADRDDRLCSCGVGHAAWLMRTSKTNLHRTIRRDGGAEWQCSCCRRRWLIFLLAHLPNGEPAYASPDQAASVRPVWRGR